MIGYNHNCNSMYMHTYIYISNYQNKAFSNKQKIQEKSTYVYQVSKFYVMHYKEIFKQDF